MGENKHIKELDAFAKKYVKEIEQEQPSFDFTKNLMQKIALESSLKVSKTKALISKKGWFGVVLALIATLCISFGKSAKGSFNLPEIDFSLFDKFQLPALFDNISVSNTTAYAFVFFGLMIAIQFTYLKKYFEKKIN
tara:strand:+ start:3927 stop:4337 length:411 start_codon:yes stop_codon:yes gene_type:complete